jgi:hypothetical protein
MFMDWASMPTQDSGTPSAVQMFINWTSMALRYAWPLVALGAIIWFLGDIRDRLAPPE